MKSLDLFGTEVYPLRASSLPLLIRCPWRAVILYMNLYDDESGIAANTGSAVHEAIRQWHGQAGGNFQKALQLMKEKIGEYPLANFTDAEKHFQAYCQDPRNQKAEIVALEQKVEFTISPASHDPAKRYICIQGTLDQVRDVNGVLTLFDIKTGSRDGWTMLHDYSYQIAAYCRGASELLKRPVQPGALIRTRGYLKRGVDPASEPPGVFYQFAWNLSHCDAILDGVRHVVARIRSGEIWLGPGDHCSWCPARGMDNCLPKLVELCQ